MEIMKTIVAIAFTIVLTLQSYASVTISVAAANLRDSSGGLMGTDRLAILVSAGADGNFSGPTASSFVSGDDIEVFRWNLSAPGTPGQFNNSTSSIFLDTAPRLGWQSGQLLELYWYPTLTLSASSPGAGTSYGAYRDPATNPLLTLDGSDLWVTPSDAGTATLNFFTTTFGGTNPEPAGLASSATPVPEPTAYAIVVGIGCLAGAVIRKKFRH
jgi:hypothetical protein